MKQEYYDLLVKKWGNFSHKQHYYTQGKMPFVSKVARLNVLFDPVLQTNIQVNQLDFPQFLPLEEFWKKTNGCRLFFGSLNIFGIQCNQKDLFEPYDYANENIRLHLEMQENKNDNSDLIFFGSMGGDLFFCFDKNEKSKIYCVKRGSASVITSYDSFDLFFNRYFDYLYNEYSGDCKKIHIDPEDTDIPVLAHLTTKVLL